MRVPQSTLRVSEDAGATPNVVAPRITPVQDQTGEQISMLGQGLAQAGAGVSRVADFLQDEMDDAVSQSVFNSYDEQSRQVAQRFRDSTGQDAITTYDQTIKQIATMRKDAEKRLQTQRQRQLFAARADSRDISLRGMLDGHAADQTRVFKIGALDAGSKNAMIAYQQSPLGSDEAKVQRELALRQQEEALRMQGKSKDEIQLARTLTLDSMHASMLDAITEQDPKTAKTYLDAHRSEVLPSTLRRAEANLERASLTETATRFMMDAEQAAMQIGGTPAQQQVNAQAMADSAFKSGQLNAAQHERTTQKIQQRFYARRESFEALTKDAFVKAQELLSKDRMLAVDDLPNPIVSQITEGGLLPSLNSFANDRRLTTDPEAFDATMGWTREQHAKMTPSEFENHLQRIASPRAQTTLRAQRRRILGSEADDVDRQVPRDVEAEQWIRQAFAPDLATITGDGFVSRQKNFVEEKLLLLDREWVAYQGANKLTEKTFTRGDYTKFLEQMAREKVRYQGRDVPLFSVPEGQQKLIVAPKYRGEENVPVIRIPVSVTWESNGAPRTESRDLFLGAMVAGGHSLTDAYEAWGRYVAAKESTAKARASFDVDINTERVQKEQNARVLRMGAGGKR